MLQYLYFVIYDFFSKEQIPRSRIATSRDIRILNFDRFLLGVLQKGYSNLHSQEHCGRLRKKTKTPIIHIDIYGKLKYTVLYISL